MILVHSFNIYFDIHICQDKKYIYLLFMYRLTETVCLATIYTYKCLVINHP